jgi:galactokinase
MAGNLQIDPDNMKQVIHLFGTPDRAFLVDGQSIKHFACQHTLNSAISSRRRSDKASARQKYKVRNIECSKSRSGQLGADYTDLSKEGPTTDKEYQAGYIRISHRKM